MFAPRQGTVAVKRYRRGELGWARPPLTLPGVLYRKAGMTPLARKGGGL